jgi:prepilin-type N-terminal cleavage/methylation domain-containing protein
MHDTSMTHRNRRAFTLIELLVVIAIIAILAAILFPVFARARENARRTSCLSNLKQLGLSIMQYTQDYDEKLPGSRKYFPTSPNAYTTWVTLLQPYARSTQLYTCPNGVPYSDPAYPSYGYNYNLGEDDAVVSLAAINTSAETVLIGDSWAQYRRRYKLVGEGARQRTRVARNFGPTTFRWRQCLLCGRPCQMVQVTRPADAK